MKQLLEENGFLVRSTSDNRKTRRQLKSMADFGVRNPKWSAGQWYDVEVKFGPKWHWSSPEQEQAYYNGEINVWWWLEDTEAWIESNR